MQVRTYTDPRDLQVYRTIKMGETTWPYENLRFDTHKIGQLCRAYGHNPQNVHTHGLLYTWDVARKACPPGWRLPTKEEWEVWTAHFFPEYFGGVYSPEGECMGIDVRAMYWSSEAMEHTAWARVFRHPHTLGLEKNTTDQLLVDKRTAMSVRCVRED